MAQLATNTPTKPYHRFLERFGRSQPTNSSSLDNKERRAEWALEILRSWTFDAEPAVLPFDLVADHCRSQGIEDTSIIQYRRDVILQSFLIEFMVHKEKLTQTIQALINRHNGIPRTPFMEPIFTHTLLLRRLFRSKQSQLANAVIDIAIDVAKEAEDKAMFEYKKGKWSAPDALVGVFCTMEFWRRFGISCYI